MVVDKPNPPVFQNREDAIRWAASEEAIDRAHNLVYAELFYQTIRDAHAYATNYTNRFKACGGDRPFDAEAAKKRAHTRIQEWIQTPFFAKVAKHMQYDPDNAKQTVLDLLEGKNVDRIEPLINKLKHEGRIYGYRGPRPKQDAKKTKKGSS
jgi:hypothetical protein